MIAREILETITPEGSPDIRPRDLPAATTLFALEDPLLLRIALWCEALRQTIAEDDELRERVLQAELCGIGIVDLAGKYELGVALYSPGKSYGEVIEVEREGMRFPIVSYEAYSTPDSGYAMNGSFAAVGEDGAGPCLITAGHCVRNIARHAPVTVRCPACGARIRTTLDKWGHLYLDIASLRCVVGTCGCETSVTQSAMATQGLTVFHHFPSSGSPVAATVKHPLDPPSAVILGSKPRTFTTSTTGQANDSGSAISTDLQSVRCLVGSHCGRQDVYCQGVKTQQSFAQDIDETLRLFNLNLIGGMYL